MKILCIAFQVGRFGPAAIAYQDLMLGLARQNHELFLLTAKAEADLPCKRIFKHPSKFRLSNRASKLVTILLKKSYENIYWELQAYYLFRRQVAQERPDLVFVITGRGKEGLTNLGLRYAKYLNIPLAIHLVDPVPPPKHWENYEIYRKSLPHGIAKAMNHAGCISMNNLPMLRHQQQYFSFDILTKGIVVPDPVFQSFTHFGAPKGKKKLLYLGSFYGKRTPDSLLFGFLKYLEAGNEAELRIVGNNQIDLDRYNIPPVYRPHFVLKNWTENVAQEYEEATVLVDVDVDVHGDVFTSSKLKRYLFVDRVILSITHQDSPSAHILQNMAKSTVICSHQIAEITAAITKACSIAHHAAIFEERVPTLEDMHADTAARKLTQKFEQLIS